MDDPPPPTADRAVEVGHVRLDPVTVRDAVRRIVAMAGMHDRRRHVLLVRVEHVARAEADATMRAAFRTADLLLAEDAVVSWLAKLAGAATHIDPVPGQDVLCLLARESGARGLRRVFLGGATGAAARAARWIERECAGARIAGTYCPPQATFHTPEEQARIVSIVRAERPDVVVVGATPVLGEAWIATRKHSLGAPVVVGLGDALDVLAGSGRSVRPGVPRLSSIAIAAARAIIARLRPAPFRRTLTT
jgi:N-acetylglucosaminyldiphosphoundecaprenol N-acetyl-beta-D-mannosaminyltransferase